MWAKGGKTRHSSRRSSRSRRSTLNILCTDIKDTKSPLWWVWQFNIFFSSGGVDIASRRKWDNFPLFPVFFLFDGSYNGGSVNGVGFFCCQYIKVRTLFIIWELRELWMLLQTPQFKDQFWIMLTLPLLLLCILPPKLKMDWCGLIWTHWTNFGHIYLI